MAPRKKQAHVPAPVEVDPYAPAMGAMKGDGDRFGGGVANQLHRVNTEQQERAFRAVARFRKDVLPILRAYAQALTKNPTVVVDITKNVACTDGKKIWVTVPIKLGDRLDHRKGQCGQRNEHLMLTCEACRVFEESLILTCHEIAHIAYGSFAEVSPYEVKRAIRAAYNDADLATRAGKIADKLNRVDFYSPNYKALANVVSPYLGMLVNAVEDARVNTEMYKARPGTYKMFKARAVSVRTSLERHDGTPMVWNELDDNTQAFAVVLDLLMKNRMPAGTYKPEIDALYANPQLIRMAMSVDRIRSAQGSFPLAISLFEYMRTLGFFKRSDDPEDDPPPPPPPVEPEERPSLDKEPRPNDDDDSADEESEDASDDDSEDEPADDSDGSEDESDDQLEDESDDESSDDAEAEPSDSDDTDDLDSDADGDEDESDDDDAGDDDGGGEQDDDADSAGDNAEEEPEQGADGDSDEEGDDADGSDDDSEGDDDDSGDGSGDDDGDADTDTDDDASGKEEGDGSEDDESAADDASDGSDESAEGEHDDDGSTDGDGEGAEPTETDEERTERERQALEDARMVFVALSGHTEDGQVEGMAVDPGDEIALKLAALQGESFDTPSTEISHVNWSRRTDGDHLAGMNWAQGDIDEYTWPGRPGPDGESNMDFRVQEEVLAPALNHARAVFAENARGRHERNLRHGKVDVTKLSRIYRDDDRIFKRKVAPGKRDYFVLVGLDNSGSTTSGKIWPIVRSAYHMAELLNRLGVKFCVYAHNGTSAQLTGGDFSNVHMMATQINIIKGPDEPWDLKAQTSLRTLKPSGCNLDGHAFEAYRKIIEQRRETDRILMYYTDGQMPDANFDEELAVLQRELALLKRMNVAVLGVGAGTDSPTAHGLETIRVDQVSDMKLLIKWLEKKLAVRV